MLKRIKGSINHRDQFWGVSVEKMGFYGKKGFLWKGGVSMEKKSFMENLTADSILNF